MKRKIQCEQFLNKRKLMKKIKSFKIDFVETFGFKIKKSSYGKIIFFCIKIRNLSSYQRVLTIFLRVS